MRSFIFLKESSSLSVQSKMKMDRIVSEISGLLGLLLPLSQVTSREALDDLLKARVFRFRQLRAELEELLWPTLSKRNEQSLKLFLDMREVSTVKIDLLGGEALEQLLGAIESAEGFDRWLRESTDPDGSHSHRFASLNQQIGKHALYADMCIDTLMGVLTDQFSQWIPEALPVLARAADDYMTEVEDVFLAEFPATKESGEAVGYESLRKELGL